MEEDYASSIQDVEEMLLQQNPPAVPTTYFVGDDTATWNYWTRFDPEMGIPDEWVWERLRNKRDQLISDCDWRVVPDAPWDTTPWQSYRQALRDLPNNTVNPRQAVWPTPPE